MTTATVLQEAEPLDQPVPDIELMNRFRAAYAAIDAEELRRLLAADFEWRLDWFEAERPMHTGKILLGVDAMVGELQRRRRLWSQVRFRHIKEKFLPGFVVQTFVISGVDEASGPFEVSAVDLYTVNGGLISTKDTYWKRGVAGAPC